MLELLKTITGTHAKPVFPAYLLNKDCSSQYYFSASIKSDSANNGWLRMNNVSLKAQGKY